MHNPIHPHPGKKRTLKLPNDKEPVTRSKKGAVNAPKADDAPPPVASAPQIVPIPEAGYSVESARPHPRKIVVKPRTEVVDEEHKAAPPPTPSSLSPRVLLYVFQPPLEVIRENEIVREFVIEKNVAAKPEEKALPLASSSAEPPERNVNFLIIEPPVEVVPAAPASPVASVVPVAAVPAAPQEGKSAVANVWVTERKPYDFDPYVPALPPRREGANGFSFWEQVSAAAEPPAVSVPDPKPIPLPKLIPNPVATEVSTTTGNSVSPPSVSSPSASPSPAIPLQPVAAPSQTQVEGSPLLRPSFVAPVPTPLPPVPPTSASIPAVSPAPAPVPAFKPMFKPAASPPPSTNLQPPPPPPSPSRAGPAPNVAAAVEGNFDGVAEESDKVGAFWIGLGVVVLLASLALCALLWNEFFTLDKSPFF